MFNRSEFQLLLEVGVLPWQRGKDWRFRPKHLLPQGYRWVDQHTAVLQQGLPMPELSATDALAAISRHQISRSGARKTAASLGSARSPDLAEMKRLSGLIKRPLQPSATVSVNSLALAFTRSHHECIGELTGMKHRPAAARATHKLEVTKILQFPPMGWPALLMTP